MGWRALLVVAGCWLLSARASAEGSAEFDLGDTAGNGAHDQALEDRTVLHVDILNGGAEKVCWRGNGSLNIYRPDETTLVGTIASGQCLSAVGGVTGAYLIEMLAEQLVGVEWDIRVCASSVSNADCLNVNANERTGRLWSYTWDFEANFTYGDNFSVNGSVYAIVPGGDVGRDAVIEMRMRGVSGAWYKLFANSVGPETDEPVPVRVGRSVPVSGHRVTPEFPLYLNPPEKAQYNWIAPEITNVALAPQCGTGVVLDSAPGAISFDSNVSGQFVVICDVNRDGVYDFADDDDFSSFGTAAVGTNTITWNGQDNAGNNAAEGDYSCVVRLNVGEFHYIAEDIETSYPGIRLFRLNAARVRTPIPMFWDDGAVAADNEPMNNVAGQISPSAPPPVGLDPGAYTDGPAPFYYVGQNPDNPTGNARAWGNFDADGKGNDHFLDQFSAADTAVSAPFTVRVVASGGDADSDGLSNARECDLGSDPHSPDSDGDGVHDGFEASETSAPNTDGDALPDILDPDDDGDGILTSVELGGENGDGNPADAANSDGAGAPDYLDTDSDDDGVDDFTDVARTDPSSCRDQDGDNCDDCTNTGADGSGGDVDNDGADNDGDQICDLTDPDDDNDGVCDQAAAVGGVCVAGPDSDPQDALVCADSDGDGCDDCAAGAGPAPGNDGLDSDGDGACNLGDPDDDNDGVADGSDGAPLDPNRCRDTDSDTCDDCANTGNDNSGGDPRADGLDSDGDGACDAGDPDDDNDGVADGSDDAPLDPNRCRDADGDSCDDCSRTGSNQSGGDPGNDGPDYDGDGVCDASDSDDDDDGVPDGDDADPFNPNVCRDTDADGCDDCAVTGSDQSGGDPGNDGPDYDGNGTCDVSDPNPDSDGDGVHDGDDSHPSDPNRCRDADADGCDDCAAGTDDPANDGPDADGDGLCDAGDPDADGDGRCDQEVEIADVCAAGPDSDAEDANVCGDTDGDGCDDCSGGSFDPSRDGPDDDGDGLCDSELDSDGDGILDGDDLDDDGDGILDRDENLLGIDPDADADDDGWPNFRDADDRGDGLPNDCADDDRNGACDQLPAAFDRDSDGTPNHWDHDADGDGIYDVDEAGHGGTDSDRDGVVDGPVGSNGVADRIESPADAGNAPPPVDTDRDGSPDFLDWDADGDEVEDADEAGDDDLKTRPRDSDGDGLPDFQDPDDDNDGIPTEQERTQGGQDIDTDEDGTPDYLDDDDDDDGVPTERERTEDGRDRDTDDDGTPDHLDPDDDGDGVPTEEERTEDGHDIDTDGDGTPDHLDDDDDDDGIPTRDEEGDADGDGVPDRLQRPPATGTLSGGALCTVSPEQQGGGVSLLVLLAAALGLWLRRARRERGRRIPAAWLLSLAVAATLASTTHAQVALEQFKPAPLASDGFGVSRPEVLDHLTWSAMVLVDYANDPLVYELDPGDSDSERVIVSDHLVVHPSLALGLGTRLTLFAAVPVHAVMEGDDPQSPTIAPADGRGLGDVAFGGRICLAGTRESAFGLAMELIARAPTARLANEAQVYSGDQVGSYEPALIAEARAGRFDIRVRAGGRLRKEMQVGNLSLGHELVAGLGARLRLSDLLYLHAEGYGSSFVGELLRRAYSPLEALFGLKYQSRSWNFGAAAGPGLLRGYGSPDVRLVAMLGYAPLEAPDSDGDGLKDSEDRCPHEPEDLDRFEDQDGCPDPDNDHDGIPDAQDQCIDQPEDADGFEDQDGCPDPDNDRDGLLDVSDRCPNQAEDTDAFEDEDGCPDTDNDHDGLPDLEDHCPNEAEDRDGFEDDDGCPEAGSPKVRLTCEKIEISESVYFDSGADTIQARSFDLLDQVVALLQKATHIQQLRIEGHTDSRGRPAYNLGLSQRRAKSVLDYLVEHGVDPARLTSEGYGLTRPIADNRTREGRAKNRRVEFNIIKQTSDCVPGAAAP